MLSQKDVNGLLSVIDENINTGLTNRDMSEINNIKLMEFETKKVTNIKNQTPYTILSSDIINATNSNEGEIMVLYTNGKKLYVREISEFGIKFEEDE